MKAAFVRPASPVWIVSFLAATTSLWAVFQPESIPVGVLRALVASQAVLAALRFLLPRPDIRLLTPIFLLPLMGLIFYVVAPIGFAAIGSPNLPTEIHDRYVTYVGSQGEIAVLQFCSLCLLAALCFRRPLETSAPPRSPQPGDLPDNRHALTALWAIAAAAAIAKLVDSRLMPFSDAPLFGLGAEIQAALPPTIYFSLAAALLISIRRSRTAFVLTAALTGGCIFLLLASDLARVPLAFSMFAIGMVVVECRISPRRIALVAVATLLAVVVATAASNSYRQLRSAEQLAPFGDLFKRSLTDKFLLRQAVSSWCFEAARKRHWDETGFRPHAGPISGLIPRVMWDEKPSLSRGGKYAIEYCEAVIDPVNPHSEALTLLAEPVIEGGKYGLVWGEAAIILFLAAASALMLRFGPIGLAAGVALLPWLTSFEQHLAFYIANGVKMFLLMLPAILLLYAIARFRQRAAGA